MYSNKVLLDIEVFSNYFLLGFKDYHTGAIESIEVSPYKNERDKLIKWLNTYKGYVIGFNTIYYDNVVLAYIKVEWESLCWIEAEEFCYKIKRFSDKVINSDSYYEELKLYKYVFQKQWIDIDLFLYWSKGLRQSKKISLKGLAVQLGYHTIMELPYDPDTYLTEKEIEKVKVYNLEHDLGVLALLCQNKKEEIQLRQYIFQSYGISCWSWDAPKIASEYLLDRYCKQTEQDKKEVRNSRHNKDYFKIGDYLPVFEFKTKLLQDLYTDIQKSYQTFSKEFVYTTGQEHNIKVSIGVGGLHTILSNTKYVSNLESIIYTSDIASLYPTNLINYGFIRPELKLVLESYKLVKKDRLQAKKEGNKTKDTFLKLILNSLTGLLDNEFSWLYSPAQINALRITGQLQLLRTLEELTLNNFKVLAINTDGIECFVDKGKEQVYIDIMNSLEQEFNFVWEHDKYREIYYRNINSYIAITESGKTKKKGEFVTNPELGNSVDFLAIPKCLELYFVKGIKPEVVLNDPEKHGLHIYDFCAAFKCSRDYQVIWNNEKQQRLNRFFVSKGAPYLYKLKSSKSKPDNMLKGWGVQLFNVYEQKEFKDYKLDNSFYLSKINEVISELEHHNQLKLF